MVLTSSLLTDRMLLYSGFLSELSRSCDVAVWATSAGNLELADTWSRSPVGVHAFPAVHEYREFPYNVARRLNEFTWDRRLMPPSRLSMDRHVRAPNQRSRVRILVFPSRLLAAAGLHEWFEDRLEILLLGCCRSPETRQRLRAERPDCVVTTNPFWFDEPGVVAEAKRLGIPVLAVIPSWDNITTKTRMVFKYDGYLVWSEQTRRELRHYYPDSRHRPIKITGAPQFDVFRQAEFEESREAFCARSGLRSDRPIIVYAIGSPNFIHGEHHGALFLAERVCAGDLGDVQMLVRPHPAKDNDELVRQFDRFRSRVVVQSVAQVGTPVTARSQTNLQILDWVSTFRHCGVVVNLSSTVTIDAALFDKPVVNVNFDPSPSKDQESLIKDVNGLWTHFRPIAESGGVALVNDRNQLLHAVRTYLSHPELHREKRLWIAEYVCGYIDGRCGHRMARAIDELIRSNPRCLKQTHGQYNPPEASPGALARA